MKNLVLASILAGLTPVASADVTINEPWARATVPGQPVGAAYMKISSTSTARLLSAESDIAKEVQVHTMQNHEGVMKMREHGQLEISAGQTVELAPGGLHLMLMGLKKPLAAGDTLNVKLTFEDAKKVKSTAVVAVPVRPIGK
ncbi:copper chaperone PCu(A)C [Noviherbaspirillum aridicola]|uniref:Copper chaperone PCu(A)C n=1 Tax=Noviherbaspirillum aridicola TaxID=2849687 RepID=A0ABQ4Q3Z6_9BURK|nr:copper chaperone PCu(A)C [Noviherbaspirillum aridicola]GIZ51900.1 hypothetical protein NCCP691_19140 [Noviherbaspirillum aridicola]